MSDTGCGLFRSMLAGARLRFCDRWLLDTCHQSQASEPPPPLDFWIARTRYRSSAGGRSGLTELMRRHCGGPAIGLGSAV